MRVIIGVLQSRSYGYAPSPRLAYPNIFSFSHQKTVSGGTLNDLLFIRSSNI
jgi:hypothetical protein